MAKAPKVVPIEFPRGDHPGHEHDEVALTPSQRKTLGIDSLMLLMPDGTPACGKFACAYNTKDPDWVVKLTSDEDDADGLARAKGSEFVVPTKGIYELKGVRDPAYQTPMYGIIAERVNPVVGKESLFINEVLFGTFDEEILKNLFSGYKEGAKFVVEPRVRAMIEPKCRLVVQEAKKYGDSRFVSEDADTEACRLLINEAVDAAEDLANRGVVFTDNHAGNWGRRKNGRLVAIDLGLSSPPWGRQKAAITRLAGYRDPVRGEFLRDPRKTAKRVWPPWGR